MLTDEEKRILKRKLEKRLCRIFASTHGEVDAEYVQMAAEFSRRPLKSSISKIPFRGPGKVIHVKLDVEAGWIILALARLKDRAFGFCQGCGEDIPYEVLCQEPTELFCTQCRQIKGSVNQN